ncbi:MAG TPA: S-layer homology domain-containing protein [Chroococcidiopsis sp.]
MMRRFTSALSLTLLLVAVSAIAQVEPQSQDPIDRVVSAGLMSRDGTGDFRANATITRAELASILVKAFRLDLRTPVQTPAPPIDVPTNHWAYQDIQTVIRTGVMLGYGGGRFLPNQRLTRAEAFAIFAQAYGVSQFPEQTIGEILAPYPDASAIPSWARLSWATALYGGFVNISTDNLLNPSQPMTRGDIAYALNQFLLQARSPDGQPQ